MFHIHTVLCFIHLDDIIGSIFYSIGSRELVYCTVYMEDHCGNVFSNPNLTSGICLHSPALSRRLGSRAFLSCSQQFVHCEPLKSTGHLSLAALPRADYLPRWKILVDGNNNSNSTFILSINNLLSRPTCEETNERGRRWGKFIAAYTESNVWQLCGHISFDVTE